MSKITPELQKQIEQEAEVEAKKLTGRVPIFRIGYEEGHYDGAEIYAEKWQEAEQKADRYEKALKEIHEKVCQEIPQNQDVGSVSAQRCIEIDEIITDLFTPKPTTDDAANG